MSKRRNITPARRKLLRLALELAVDHERAYIDAYKGCTDPSDLEVVAAARDNIRQFRVLHAILRDEPTS